jgi:uncharacterized membrane protein YeaQ/YmgE (transglycosylase-associated protein family)
MDFLIFLVFGLVVGGIAKLLYPGNERMGCISTMALGILGSVMGGVIAKFIWKGGQVQPAGWIMSIIGAVIVLAVVSRTKRLP